ncbi:MAG TPA: hypothetical protein VNT01_13435 [Symbiobacteriaceae bacterium]|nr:hypothetical protein [Symbiobacteriaceae bacterium]
MALSDREKRLLLIPVALGAMVAFYTWVHEPLFARRAEAAGKVDAVSAELRRSETRLAKERDLRVRREAVAAREKVVDAWVPGKNSAALFIWYLSQAELQSGARIKGITVSDKKQVAAAPQQPAGAKQAPTTTGSAPVQGSRVASMDSATPQGQPTAAPATDPAVPAPTLTVIQLELKVDARFAQHLQFNQSMESMPLFLNTNSLAMEKEQTATLEEMGKLIQGGNASLAAQLLAISPNLNGTYKVDLYFKADKQGPMTGTMQFAEAAGRLDPFANIDEFIDTILRFYSNQPAPDGSRGPLPTLPPGLRGQLG